MTIWDLTHNLWFSRIIASYANTAYVKDVSMRLIRSRDHRQTPQ